MSSFLSRYNSSLNSRSRNSSKNFQSRNGKSNQHFKHVGLSRFSRNELNPESYKSENSLRIKTANNGFGNHGSVFERTSVTKNFGHDQGKFNRFKRGSKRNLEDYVKPLSTYRSRRESDKPVARLFDPTAVPRAGRYFEHDSRDRMLDNNNYLKKPIVRYAIKRAIERNMYDPRIDRGSCDNHKSSAPTGWRNHPFKTKRVQENKSGFSDDGVGSLQNLNSRDGVWRHDKFEELEHEKNVE